MSARVLVVGSLNMDLLAACQAEGRTLRESLGRAHAAGALAVTRPGAISSLPPAGELENPLSGRPSGAGVAS